MTDQTTRLILLRHGEVASHKGDVPVIPAGLAHAETVGAALRHQLPGDVSVRFGGTRRTRETAEAIVRGLRTGTGAGPDVDGPSDAFALRNPDMYLAGARVNMVSSPASLAEQVIGLEAADVEQHTWWMHFIAAADRIGWWLAQEDPPGENGRDLAERIRRFARSLADHGPTRGRTVIGVTHSPVLRSVLLTATGADPGEPAYVTGADVLIAAGVLHIGPFDALAPTPST
jgi:broad specificity phosphatase PhoE